jgi:hypothetical protein
MQSLKSFPSAKRTNYRFDDPRDPALNAVLLEIPADLLSIVLSEQKKPLSCEQKIK